MDVDPKIILMLKRLDPQELLEWMAATSTTFQDIEAGKYGEAPKLLNRETDVILAAAHKARNAFGPMHFTIKELRESRQWLADNGYRSSITKHGTH